MGTPRQIYLEFSSLNILVLIMYILINYICIFFLNFSLSCESIRERKLTLDEPGFILITVLLYIIMDEAIFYPHYDQ